MKKIVLSLMAMVGSLTMQADETYSYLTFETASGTKVSVSTASLTLIINGTTLTAGSQSFELSNLSKMYFSTSDESTTGIGSLSNEALDESTEIYNLQGHKISKEQMKSGVYIIKTKNNTYKLIKK